MIALLLILEAVVFFVIYNQMSSTLILFAQNNSDHNIMGFNCFTSSLPNIKSLY